MLLPFIDEDSQITPDLISLRTTPSARSIYDVVVALEFFKSAGSMVTVPAGKTIFAENEKSNRLLLQRDKMYLLLEGKVNISSKNKPIGTVRIGEVFGEMAPISQMPRSASATAVTACNLIALDDKQFQAALNKKPEFAIMLMSLMVDHLRGAIARLDEAEVPPEEKWNESRVFDKKLLDYLAQELGGGSRIHYKSGKVIVEEGHAGILMYVVLKGRVAIYIQNSMIEKIGPGGMFGEMALIEHSQRLASAIAETDCSLLAINRTDFINLVKSSPAFGLSLLGAVSERTRFIASRNT